MPITRTRAWNDAYLESAPVLRVIDEERGRTFCEILKPFTTPGDGSIHEAANITVLTPVPIWRDAQ